MKRNENEAMRSPSPAGSLIGSAGTPVFTRGVSTAPTAMAVERGDRSRASSAYQGSEGRASPLTVGRGKQAVRDRLREMAREEGADHAAVGTPERAETEESGRKTSPHSAMEVAAAARTSGMASSAPVEPWTGGGVRAPPGLRLPGEDGGTGEAKGSDDREMTEADVGAPVDAGGRSWPRSGDQQPEAWRNLQPRGGPMETETVQYARQYYGPVDANHQRADYA
jgi:hypothetical protein